METLIVLVKLICAHLCADFVFQTDALKNGKLESGAKGLGFHLLHSTIHAVVAYLFVAEWTCWPIPTVIFATHFIIDFTKYKMKGNSLCSFLVDQLCHITVIATLWFILYGNGEDLSFLNNICSTKVWVIGIAYILMLKPSSVLLSLFLDKWAPASPNTQSLPNAGQWIGYIERFLILTFVLIGSIEGVGFLLTAKSVFRFGELNKAQEIRTTEYVLIGTLASFTIAIITGITVTHLLQ